MPTTKQKSKKKVTKIFPLKGLGLLMLGFIGIAFVILWSSLFKAYPVKGQKQMLAIGTGDTYSGFIDRLGQEDKVSFPIILKLYQKFIIHDTLKAGVYEVQKGMSIRQVMEMLSNSENAQMNRILVIEGTTFKQLLEQLKKDDLVTKDVLNLPQEQMLKALNIPFEHPEGLFAPDTYFFAKGETDKKILTDLYQRQMKSLDKAWEKRATDLPYKNKY